MCPLLRCPPFRVPWLENCCSGTPLIRTPFDASSGDFPPPGYVVHGLASLLIDFGSHWVTLANSHTLSMRLLTKNESRNECFVHSSQYSYTHTLLYDLVSLFVFLHRSQYSYTHIYISLQICLFIFCAQQPLLIYTCLPANTTMLACL